jgi:hypothetical protein
MPSGRAREVVARKVPAAEDYPLVGREVLHQPVVECRERQAVLLDQAPLHELDARDGRGRHCAAQAHDRHADPAPCGPLPLPVLPRPVLVRPMLLHVYP